MSQIWYAAFSEDFVEQAQKIFKILDKDVIVTVWDPELVPEMLRRGVSVILGRGATAVSYTHLDVYKRQVHNMPQLILTPDTPGRIMGTA